MATFEFTLRGDQIATYSSLSGNGNGADRVVTLNGTTPLGSATDVYTVRVEQAAADATQFTNGQWITILNSSGGVVMSQTNVQNDAEQGMGAGDEHLIIGTKGFVIDIGGFDPGPQTVQYGIADETATSFLGDNDGELDFADTRTTFPCFGTGTMIRVPGGEARVEDLRAGDLVSTLDAGPQPLAWTASRHVDFAAPGAVERPVLIPRHSLWDGLPDRDTVLSMQHCVLLGGGRADGAALLPAKALTGLRGVRVMRGLRTIRYHSLMLASHQLVWANGTPCESFYPGDYIMRMLAPALRAEILALFPMLRFGAAPGYGPRARPADTVQAARRRVAALRGTPSRAAAMSA